MTAILQNLQQLDAARKRGDLTPEEYSEIKQRMLNAIEDANELPVRREATPQARATVVPASPTKSGNLFGLVMAGLGTAGVMTFVVAQVIGDLMIALTLTLTSFAAILIAAAKRMEH